MMARCSLTAPNLQSYDVVVFDLDDTMYSEKSYVDSGYQAISSYIAKLYDIDFYTLIKQNLSEDNVLKSALKASGLGEYLLSQLIQIYRYHKPKIKLLPNIEDILKSLKERHIPLYIITDGRSLTQRLKIEALDVKPYFSEIFISEEQGHEKPSLHSFQQIQNRHPESKIVYIGDNPKKDFIAPHQLQWDTIGIKHEDIRVHKMNIVEAPKYWLNNTNELVHS